MSANLFYGKDILSVKQFGRSDLQYLFDIACEMRVGSPTQKAFELRNTMMKLI